MIADEVERILPLLSSAVLRSAWVEPDAGVRAIMWEPMLTFLTRESTSTSATRVEKRILLTRAGVEHRKAWELDIENPVAPAAHDDDSAEEDGDEDSSAGSEDDEEPRDARAKEAPQAANSLTRSEAYQEFLQFLQLGCSGSPVQGYPTVVVILSTIPSSVKSIAQQSL